MPLPYCLCGCQRRVKWRKCRYFSQACVPKQLRSDGARLSRRVFAWRRRRQRFADELQRLKGRHITQEELLDAFKRIERRAYQAGWMCGRAGHTPTIYVSLNIRGGASNQSEKVLDGEWAKG